MKYIKYMIIRICRFLLKAFCAVPLKKNRIYFSSNLGQSISCNPFYIYKYMKKQYPNEFEFIWEYRNRLAGDECKTVKPSTLKSLYYLMTSKVIISNDGLGSYIPKRKQQLFINTWHGGGAYKKSGVNFITDQHKVDLKINEICGGQTDIFLSSCKKFTEVMSGAKMVAKEKFLECGMPRNDLLINQKKSSVIKKVKEKYGIASDCKIVLYAPTYRGEEKTASFDSRINIEKCLLALQNRFDGEWVFLVRKHHFVKESVFSEGIDVSSYRDMQELLYAADVFITDYSSTIWDYSLTEKPGFLFAPDIKEYGEERCFYTPPETWAFPIAESNEGLEKLILSYEEEEAKKKIARHLKLLGNCESGNATEHVAKLIWDFSHRE